MHQALVGDASLTALVPTERWFQLGAVIDVPRKPFVVLQWLSPVSGDARGSFAHQLQVRVYGDRGSYALIDTILGGPHRSGGIYSVLAGMENLEGPDGRVTCCDYLGTGGDDSDVDYKANLRYSSWQIVGRTTS